MITMELTERRKTIFKWVGYPLLALLTFVFTVAYTFPYDRLKETIVTRLERDYDVSIASLGPTLLPGGIVIDTMMLETRPDEEDSEPAVLVIDRAKVRTGLFSMLTGSMSVDVDVEIGDGTLEGEVDYGGDGFEARLETRSLPLDRLPMKAAVGLPMTGHLELDAEVEIPEMRFSKAGGSLNLSCSNCTIGDGETQIRPRTRQGRAARSAAFAQGGLTVPRIDLGTMRGDIALEDGQGEIEELSAVSPDGELHVTGELVLADPVMRSTLPGCIRFKLSEDFQEREPGFGNTSLWMPSRSRQDDGFYAVPTQGTFKNFKWNPRQTCEGEPTTGGDAQASTRSRPSVTLRPDEDERSSDNESEPSDREDDREPPSVATDDESADAGRADEDEKEEDEKEEDEKEEDESDEEADEARRERAEERRREIIEERRSERERPEDVEAPVGEDEIRDGRDRAYEDEREGDYREERRREGEYEDEREGDYPDERPRDEEYEDNEVDYEVR